MVIREGFSGAALVALRSKLLDEGRRGGRRRFSFGFVFRIGGR